MCILNPSNFGMTEDQLMYHNGNACGFARFNDINKQMAGYVYTAPAKLLDLTICTTPKFKTIDIPNREYVDSITRAKLKDKVYLDMAKNISLLGTCQRMKAGCLLLTLEGRVAGAGYNGAGPGMAHCDPKTCNINSRCLRCTHSETNALSHRSGHPHTAYITHEPCLNCARELILAGVKAIKFDKPYTSISDEERKARQEWIDHHQIKWLKIC
jgi:dCMP deaminase